MMPRGFQFPATSVMEEIIQLHHYVMFYLVVILFFVLSLLISILWEFYFVHSYFSFGVIRRRWYLLYNLDFTHWSSLEFIWTLLPALILVLIAFPSFSLLYAMDEVVAPHATLKVVGHQWYWSYDWTIFKKTYDEFESFVSRDDQLLSGHWVPGISFREYALRRFIDLTYLKYEHPLARQLWWERHVAKNPYLQQSGLPIVVGKTPPVPKQFLWMLVELGRTLDFELTKLYFERPSFTDRAYKATIGRNVRRPLHSYLLSLIELSGRRLLETDVPLLFPVGVPVRVLVTADDVLHSWAVPSFGVKIDCVPGRLNQVHVKVNRFGHFFGQCSELCGVNHAQMPIEIFSVSPSFFEAFQGRLNSDEKNANWLAPGLLQCESTEFPLLPAKKPKLF
jgi:heme/copper-type cytochrome/quinol oxidase subunit 2